MMTTSHAFFTYALMPTGPAMAQAVIGSVLPDVPFLIAPAAYAAWQGRWAGCLTATRDGLVSGLLLRAGHSLVIWAVAAGVTAALAPRWLPLIWGWFGHVAADFVTHHGEPHAHFYPLSDWRFASPVSYYEWDHHAAVFMAGEGILAAMIMTSWVRHESLLATAAWLVRQPGVWAVAGVLLIALWQVYRQPDTTAVPTALQPRQDLPIKPHPDRVTVSSRRGREP
ncbi:MAG: hypothetical protein H7338_11490 [Candidatus Sericytochromatia bacterium]|nr:hypothetical protein [Candidatus Sericytochromatia bacterium]